MKRIFGLLLTLLLSPVAAHSITLNMEWAYHDDADGIDQRTTEKVPGEEFTFLANGSDSIPTDQDITLYVLAAKDFAGPANETIYLRWWDGTDAHWVQGDWVKNISLGREEAAGLFHGYPRLGFTVLDLWKVVVPAENTKPGDNYYVLQLKGWDDQGDQVQYLLRDDAGEQGSRNELGQAWTASEEAIPTRDWKVVITE